jgi:GTP cyclohydrolase FolE2
MTLADIQSEIDSRGIGLDEVGISGLRYPVSVFDAEQGKQDTVATVALSVSLPPEQKGSHLSRFVEVIDDYAGELTPQTIPRLLRSLQERLDSPTARLQVSFPYFVRRHAPISKGSALIDYSCGFAASVRGDQFHLVLSAGVPVTSVCPCSKAISDYGAHNQRGYLTIDAVPATNEEGQFASIWMEDLIDAAEASASSPVFPLLKRADERHVTMLGYDQPVFVEDMVRAVADRFRSDPRIERFSVEAINDESIHNHGAFARLVWPPTTGGESGRW